MELPLIHLKPTASHFTTSGQDQLLSIGATTSSHQSALLNSSCVKPMHKKILSRSGVSNTGRSLAGSKVKKTDSVQEVMFKECKISSKEVNRRYHHAAVLQGSKLYVHGGYESDIGILEDFKVFEEVGVDGQWR